MNIYTIGLLVSIVVYFGVGSYAGRKVKHLEDYFVAGRQAPTLLIVGSLVASFLSTNAFLGETGIAYSGHPNVLLIMTAINIAGYVIGALYFGRFLRRSRALTVAEYFGQRFNSQRVQSAAGITIVLGLTGYLVVVTQGTATIVHAATGMSFHFALFLTWMGYTWFTLYSGSRGVVITDTIMFMLFSVVAFLGLGFIVDNAGGWFSVINQLASYEAKPDIISWHSSVGPETDWKTPVDVVAYAVILGLAWGTVVAVSPWQASRYLLARDEHTVIRAAATTSTMIMVLYIVLMFAGASINLLNPGIEPAQESMIWAAMNAMPTAVGVLLMSGIMAAGLSSASTFLSLVGFSVSHDLVAETEKDEQKQLKSSRRAMLGVSVAALIIASLTPEGKIFWITYFVGTIYASSWGMVAFMSVWSDRITEKAAFWGIIVGFAGNACARLALMLGWIDLPLYLHPLVIGAVASYICIELCIARSQVSEEEHKLREELHHTPSDEIDAGRQNRTRVITLAVMIAGVIVSAVMFWAYALPYGEATGNALGVTLLVLGFGIAMVLTGFLALRGSERSYRNNSATLHSSPAS